MNSTKDYTNNSRSAAFSQTFNLPCKRAVYLFSLFDFIMKYRAERVTAIWWLLRILLKLITIIFKEQIRREKSRCEHLYSLLLFLKIRTAHQWCDAICRQLLSNGFSLWSRWKQILSKKQKGITSVEKKKYIYIFDCNSMTELTAWKWRKQQPRAKGKGRSGDFWRMQLSFAFLHSYHPKPNFSFGFPSSARLIK